MSATSFDLRSNFHVAVATAERVASKCSLDNICCNHLAQTNKKPSTPSMLLHPIDLLAERDFAPMLASSACAGLVTTLDQLASSTDASNSPIQRRHAPARHTRPSPQSSSTWQPGSSTSPITHASNVLDVHTTKASKTMRLTSIPKAHQRMLDAATTSARNDLGIVTPMLVHSGRCFRALLLATLLVACATHKPGSIGAILSRDNETGAVYVRDLVPGLAAEKAGIEPGDEIVMIDGRYVRDLEAVRVRELLRGDVDTFVRLTLVRGQLVLRLRLARSQLRDPQEDEPKPKVETIAE